MPTREDPELVATVYAALPLPVPLAVVVIHAAPLDALQEHPGSAVTVNEAVPPAAVGVAEVGLSERVEQGSEGLGAIATDSGPFVQVVPSSDVRVR